MTAPRAPRTNYGLVVFALLAAVACDEGGFAEPQPDPTTPAGEESSPNPPTTPLGKTPTSVAIVSGDGQNAARVGDLAEPMVVRVTDERGIRVAGVPVSWRVVKGEGSLRATTTLTGTEGLTSADVYIYGFAPTVVEASVAGVTQRASFQINPTIQVIDMRFGTYYAAWERLPVIVPTRTSVEIVNYENTPHSVVTLTVPPRGEPIDSGSLAPGERFAFFPNVNGTWTITCGIHDDEEVGELIVSGN